MRTIRKITTAILLLSAILLLAAAIIPRRLVVDIFTAQNHIKDHGRVQLVAILGGGMNGQKLGASTKERLDRSIPFIKSQHPEHLIVCEYRKYREKLSNYLLKNGINKDKIAYSTFEYSDSNSGTLNNVLEILDYMNKAQVRQVVVVTSPYHEKRVKLLFDRLTPKDKNISVSFLHVNYSEIFTTSYRRYVSLIVHETGAIAVDWVKHGLNSCVVTMRTAKHRMLSDFAKFSTAKDGNYSVMM